MRSNAFSLFSTLLDQTLTENSFRKFNYLPAPLDGNELCSRKNLSNEAHLSSCFQAQVLPKLRDKLP
jgi:hypothetical protein